MIQRGLRTIYARLTVLIVPVPTPQDRKIKCRRRIVALATAAFLAALGIGGTFIALVQRHQAEQQRRMVHDIGMRHASALQRHVDHALSSTLALLSRIHPDSGERHILVRSSETPLQQATPFDVMVANGRWILAIVPHGGWHILSIMIINCLLVLFSSLLVGSLVYALLQYSQRLRQAGALAEETGHRQHDAEIVSELAKGILLRLAGRAAVAIGNAQLYKNQKIRARCLSTLTRLNQLISSSLDMDAVLRKIAQAAATLTDVPFVRMWGADEATQPSSVRASSAAQSEVGRGSTFHFTARFGVQTGQIVQSEPPVDLTVLMGIVDGDKALMAEVGEIFLQDYPVQMIELGKAIENGDAGQLERAAHSLKSALGSIGAKSAWRLAYELETMGRTTQLHEAASILQQLTAELERLTAFLADPSWVDRV